MPEKECELTVQKESQSVVDFLWEQVWLIRKSNAELQVIVNHLQQTIGS